MSESPVVNVLVISPDTRSARRFDLHTKVSDLKSKLEMITGIPASSQKITLYNTAEDADSSRGDIVTLDEDERAIGFYSLRNGHVLKVSLLRWSLDLDVPYICYL